MMIESMAGKSASMHGLVHDASPFTFSEEEPAIDHFGKLLAAGTLTFSGTTSIPVGKAWSFWVVNRTGKEYFAFLKIPEQAITLSVINIIFGSVDSLSLYIYYYLRTN